jgi:hypothetical protein
MSAQIEHDPVTILAHHLLPGLLQLISVLAIW